MSAPSNFELLGGEAALREVVSRFIDAVTTDLTIGFFFRNVAIGRLKEREYQLAAAHLGGPVIYTGRPLPAAHAPHPIREGHFARRLKLLEDTLRASQVPDDVAAAWLAHDRGLKESVVRGHCNSPPRGLPLWRSEP
jgi:hemoglobin